MSSKTLRQRLETLPTITTDGESLGPVQDETVGLATWEKQSRLKGTPSVVTGR